MKTIKLSFTVCVMIMAVFSLSGLRQNCFAAETSGRAGAAQTAQYIFSEFENKLRDAGLEYTVETFEAEAVGAQDGRRYKIGNGRAEVFFFDASTEDYQKAAQTGRISFREYHISAPAVQNGAAFIYIDNLDDIKKQLIDIFNAL